MATLSAEQLEVLGSDISASEIERALRDLMQDSVDNLDDFQEFCATIRDCDGDLTQMLGKTHEPVGIEEFITDPYFLGFEIVDDDVKEQKGKHVVGVWKPVYEAIREIVNGGYVESLLMGAIGIGKTTAAQIITAYNLYLLSCELWPQLRYGLMPGSDIVMVCMNVTDTLACQVTYGGLRGMMEEVPYFKEQYPMNSKAKSIMQFPRGIRVEYSAAYANKILGKNVIGGIVDELNFMAVLDKSAKALDGGHFNQAVTVYNTLVRRLKSRFDTSGNLPGCICLVSSKGYPDDFTEVRKREALAEKDNLTYVFDKAQWEVRPKSSFKKKGTFFVEIGNARYNTRILTDKKQARKNAELVEVPNHFYTDFVRDPLGSLRDFGGRTTDSSAPYFYDRNLVWGMADYFEELGYEALFVQNEIDFDHGYPDVTDNYIMPNPDRPRSCHVDLSLSRDSCGIAVGHVFKVSKQRVLDPRSETRSVEDFPHVAYDVVLIVKPPKGGQIEFSEVRQLIYFMRDTVGLPIKWVTYDGFQSVDSQQILRKHKFKTDHLSVESLDTYADVRAAMFFHKRLAAREHEIAFGEFAKMEADLAKGTIDHPPKGSKDGCDAMTGVFVNLSQQRSSWTASLREIDNDIDIYADTTALRRRGGAGNVSSRRERPSGRTRRFTR